MIQDRRVCSLAAATLAAATLATAAPSAQLTWRQAGAQIPARRGQFAFFDEPRGRVTVFQGQDTLTTFINDCWQLDGNDWVQVSAATPITPPRGLGAACDDVGGGGLMFGGAGAGAVGTIFGDTLRFDPQSAQVLQLQPATSPPARSVTAMACDSARRRVVLFGGADARLRGDTWEWDGGTWTQRFPPQSPSPRSGHVMAYDVARGCVVLYGGRQSAPLSDTWTYDGTTWTNVSPATGPGAIFHATMAYDAARGVTVLFGGQDGGFNVNGNTWEWNGATWTQRSAGPPARALASLTYDKQRRRVTLIGGQDQAGTLLRDAWTWDGTNWTQVLPGARGTLVEPPARSFGILAYSERWNKTVLFGGFTHQGIFDTPLNDTWESAGRLWQRRTPPVSPPGSFSGAGAILRSTGELYYLPGSDILGNSYNEQWNWGGSQWAPLALSAPAIRSIRHQVLGSLQSSLYGWVFVRLVTSGTAPFYASTLQLIQPFSGNVAAVNVPGGPGPRTGSTMIQSHSATIASNKVWLFGGRDANGVDHNDVWELADTGSGGNLAWTQLVASSGPVPPARSAAAVAYYPVSDRIYVMGGAGAAGTLADAWSFHLPSSTWLQEQGAVPTARSGAAATFDASIGGVGKLVLVGGFDGTNVLGDIWECDGLPWTRRLTPTTPPARGSQTMVYDRDQHRAIVFGGDGGLDAFSIRVSLDDTWAYDGTTWSPIVATGSTPTGRYWQAACFDEAWRAMVMFGDDTRILRGGAWWPGAAGPAPRRAAAMVYVASQGRCLLFGGLASSALADGWTYDLTSDRWQSIPGGPPARSNHGMAYDRLRDRVVLFGGSNSSDLNDTWEWQAATGWQQRTPPHSPPPRQAHAMAYDEARARTIVLGGYVRQSGTDLDDVWEWDGTDWLQRTPETTGPQARRRASMVCDPDNGRLTLFGGYVGQTGMTDSTWHLNAPIDTTGRGNTANPEGLRYWSQPVLGQTFKLGFNNPQGLALFGFAIGPMQQPIAQIGAPLCELSNLYTINWFGVVTGRTEPNVPLSVGNDPSLRGLVLVFQMFSYQQTGCFRATDAINVRFD